MCPLLDTSFYRGGRRRKKNKNKSRVLSANCTEHWGGCFWLLLEPGCWGWPSLALLVFVGSSMRCWKPVQACAGSKFSAFLFIYLCYINFQLPVSVLSTDKIKREKNPESSPQHSPTTQGWLEKHGILKNQRSVCISQLLGCKAIIGKAFVYSCQEKIAIPHIPFWIH